MTAMEISSPRTGCRLRRLYFETGHWPSDFCDAWLTGCGRVLPQAAAPVSRPSIYGVAAPGQSRGAPGDRCLAPIRTAGPGHKQSVAAGKSPATQRPSLKLHGAETGRVCQRDAAAPTTRSRPRCNWQRRRRRRRRRRRAPPRSNGNSRALKCIPPVAYRQQALCQRQV